MPPWGRQLRWMPDTQGPIAKGTIRTTFVLGLRLVVQAGTLLLVARMLGPHQFGAFAGVAALAVMLGTLSTFGTHLVLLGEVSKDPARREAVLPYAVPGTLLCGIALLAVYLALCTSLLHESKVGIHVLLAIGITETMLQPLFSLIAAEHLALGRIARSQLLQVLPLSLRLGAAAAVLLMRTPTPLPLYSYGYLAASVLALAVASSTMPAPWPRLQRWRLPTKPEMGECAGYAALTITATTPAELDKTLATKLLPLSAAGIYAVGARVIGAATLPVMAMMLSALPRLFRQGESQPQSTRSLLRLIATAALGYSITLAAALWCIAPAFVELFGSRYDGIQHTIRWLCLAVPGISLRVAIGNVLMALGKPWMRAGFEVIGLFALVLAAIILTRTMGMTGMVLALALSEWTMAISGALLLYRTLSNPNSVMKQSEM